MIQEHLSDNFVGLEGHTRVLEVFIERICINWNF